MVLSWPGPILAAPWGQRKRAGRQPAVGFA